MSTPIDPAATEQVLVALLDAVREQSGALRFIQDQLDRIIEILRPPPNDGPTLDDLLAEIVVRLNALGMGLRTVDNRVISLTDLSEQIADRAGVMRPRGLPEEDLQS